MPPTVDDDGNIWMGSWGVVRDNGTDDRTLWSKLDGAMVGLGPDLAERWFNPLDPVPWCYDYDNRQDPVQCPDGGMVLWYNGTVEGTPTHHEGLLYVGRGDGKLYAINATSGTTEWVFSTFNPLDPNDPDGGGEIIAAPTVAPDGTIYIASLAAGPYETNAVYAVWPDGALRWRYPAADATLENTVFADPALSPDGSRLYVPGAWGPTAEDFGPDSQGAIYAFDLDSETLAWRWEPVNESEWWLPTVWITSLAVGTDGTLYASGPEYTLGGGSAVAFAVNDEGDHATLRWGYTDLQRDVGQMSYGLALDESDGVTERVLVTSGHTFNVFTQGYPDGGVLSALDAATGGVLWTVDPVDHGWAGSPQHVALDRDGTAVVAISGTTDRGVVAAVNDQGDVVWSHEVQGLLEWGGPVIGPNGEVVVGDSRRCLFDAAPVELELCTHLDAWVTVIDSANAGEPEPEPEPAGPPACGCATGPSSAYPTALLVVLLTRRYRRR